MPGSSSRGPQELGDLGRYAGLGLQFALTMAVLGALGWWLDRRFGTLPWLLVTGVLVGALGGFVRIVKAVPGKSSFTPKHPPLPDEVPEIDPWAEPESSSRPPASKKERAE
ncbi:MAG: AtpZ/AtpI family protein [Planctomycetota bacterium]|nr:AtpZ/AtpI family protein [Planctomycetota bacterium]